MSWDLYLFRKNDEPLNWDEVVAYFRKQPNFFDLSNGWFRYYNKATGVYCTFGPPDGSEDEEDEENEGFPVHEADVWFNLNYLRATFFASESLQVLEDFAKTFDLLVFDPQNWDQKAPCPFDYDALLKTWKEGNLFALRSIEKKPPFLSPDRSEILWKYLRSRKELQAQVGEEIFVPALGIVRKNPGDTVLQIMTLWNDAIPQVFPPCDLVLVGRERKLALFRRKWDWEAIPYAKVMDMFGEYMDPFEGPVPGMKILRPDRARQVERTFREVKLDTKRNRVRAVEFDEFVDVQV